MKLVPRIIAIGITTALAAAACGGATGDTSTAVKASQAPAAAPATQAAPAAPKFLIVVGDTIRGNLGLNPVEILTEAPGIHCTQQSRFPVGGRIVWRMKVIDPTTGKYMDDKQIKSVTLTLPDGKLGDPFKYSGHGGTKENPADFLWATGFTI